MADFKKIVFVLFAFLLITKALSAQNKETGSWSILNAKATLNSKWSAYTEFQLRSLSLYDRFYYYELKGGVTWSFLPKYSFTLGTGIYNTFDEGEEDEHFSRQKEARLWQQFIMDQKLSVMEIQHRYRTEQRFKGSFENRFRYRLQVAVPINKREITANALYMAVYNEIFFTDKQPHFSRNRFHTGVGYVLTENISVQSGWLRQVDFNTDQTRRKSYFLLSISYKM